MAAEKCSSAHSTPFPPRRGLVRWSGTRRDTTAIYDFRIDADYREPHGGFRPVKVTYRWEEGGKPKEHVFVARRAEEMYHVVCPAEPMMKAIILELAE
jgi:hypothetical protein